MLQGKSYLTKNRSLTLKEYDDKGNLIDCRVLPEWVAKVAYESVLNYGGIKEVSRAEYYYGFSDEQWEFIKLIYKNPKGYYFYDNNFMEYCKCLFEKNPIEKLLLAASLSKETYCMKGNLNVHPTSEFFGKKFDFEEALKFIEERPGIYYAVDKQGRRTYDFVDKPTKRQASYQRNKNGYRVVFLSFRDWKEYVVDEEQLV